MPHKHSIFIETEPDSRLPVRGTNKSAGVDVCAYIPDHYEMPSSRLVRAFRKFKAWMGDRPYKGEWVSHFTIPPHETVMVRSGVRLREELPHGYYIQMSLRSSWRKKGLDCNSVGIIDGDYLDEIKHLVCNSSNKPVKIENGERLSQFVVLKHHADVLGCPIMEQKRTGGFGSTGK